MIPVHPLMNRRHFFPVELITSQSVGLVKKCLNRHLTKQQMGHTLEGHAKLNKRLRLGKTGSITQEKKNRN